MTFLSVYLTGLAVIIGFMTILWLVSLALKNASIVDIFWGAGFVLSAWLYFAFTPDGFLPRKLLLVILVTIWGLRLSTHIFLRNKGKPEDFRYQKWREENGSIWWWKSFFQVFLLQGLLLWVISLTLLAAQYFGKADHLTILDFAGAAIWIVGFYFESVGDFQLKRFIKNPENRGKVLSSGVWRYTRHPNYFGDAAQWWGYYPDRPCCRGMVEHNQPDNHDFPADTGFRCCPAWKNPWMPNPDTRQYVESTSAFIPWFPKKLK